MKIYVFECLSAFTYVHMYVVGVCGGQKRAIDSLELNL